MYDEPVAWTFSAGLLVTRGVAIEVRRIAAAVVSEPSEENPIAVVKVFSGALTTDVAIETAFYFDRTADAYAFHEELSRRMILARRLVL
jgi:hypothetical protein